jgi:hypothetical protein
MITLEIRLIDQENINENIKYDSKIKKFVKNNIYLN